MDETLSIIWEIDGNSDFGRGEGEEGPSVDSPKSGANVLLFPPYGRMTTLKIEWRPVVVFVCRADHVKGTLGARMEQDEDKAGGVSVIGLAATRSMRSYHRRTANRS